MGMAIQLLSTLWGEERGGVRMIVDAEPVKRGKWIDKTVADDIKLPQMQEAKCSVCGRYLSTPYVYYWTTYKYCPNCGSLMGEEK